MVVGKWQAVGTSQRTWWEVVVMNLIVTVLRAFNSFHDSEKHKSELHRTPNHYWDKGWDRCFTNLFSAEMP